ncbi:MAG TPA: twin-arginine translocation pathway signal, partial [Brevundimonas sp.]|nr:twin-arginine translocation pathway signal [Brevundimonas sp.]
MRLSRRGLILGGSALLAGCSSAASTSSLQLAGAVAPNLPTLPDRAAPAAVQIADVGTTIDPHGVVRKDLIERARAAMDVHGHKISKRDRMYLVDFQKFSGEDRLYEVDLEGGWVTAYRTSHGRGS